jgi:hypothetical protein
MRRELRGFDWHRFWLQEVVFLSVPMLLMVIMSRQNPPLDKPKLVILVVVLLCITIVNVIQNRIGKARHSSPLNKFFHRHGKSK